MNSIPNRYCKDLQTCYFEYFESGSSCSSIMIILRCRKPCCQSVEMNFQAGHFDVYLHVKKSNSSVTSFLRYCKDIANLLLWELCKCLAIPIKTIVSICSTFSCLSVCKKSTSLFTSSSLQDIVEK